MTLDFINPDTVTQDDKLCAIVRDMMKCVDKSTPTKTPTQQLITTVTNELDAILQIKNIKYGDSALHPVHIFSKKDAETGITIRMDDKMSRIINSDNLRKNDIVDLMGYLVLLCISKGWTNFKELYE